MTCMQVGEIVEGEQTKEFLISGSRDKSLIIWDIQDKGDNDLDKEWGTAKKVFKGKILNFEVLILSCRPFSLH